jgi:hypothetical protein
VQRFHRRRLRQGRGNFAKVLVHTGKVRRLERDSSDTISPKVG